MSAIDRQVLPREVAGLGSSTVLVADQLNNRVLRIPQLQGVRRTGEKTGGVCQYRAF
ncbi:MAG: hypothetical protein HYY25_13795 [Candidatus Wallbacteria bacterium]|nr:hypothetical protein [Candidatus Wallbacteria bacterium]